jgi:hypothetical protein
MGICGSVDEGDVASDQKNQTGKDGQRGSLQFPPGLAPKEYVMVVFEPNENTKYSHDNSFTSQQGSTTTTKKLANSTTNK